MESLLNWLADWWCVCVLAYVVLVWLVVEFFRVSTLQDID